MLIEEDGLEISCSQWHPGDTEWVARVRVGADLTAVMPYINAVAKRPEYVPSLPAVIWREGEHQFAVRPHEIAINHLADSGEAERVAREVIDWMNGLWESREDMTPLHEPRTPPPLMSVLKLLPMNNCGECGLPTCTAFAVQLIDGDRQTGDCPALLTEEGAASAERLREMGLS